MAIGALCLALSAKLVDAQTTTPASPSQPVALDSVIAIINGDVLLQSDLTDEMHLAAIQPFSVPPGENSERRAAQRLISRTLILQQIKAQGFTKDITEDDVQKSLGELRSSIPVCVRYKCKTAEGWASFLKDHDLTPEEVDAHWRQRLLIIAFIDLRFRAGIRISKPEIEDYYKKMAPQFEKEKIKPPPLASVSDRIEEILLQQHVNLLLQDWLKSLRDQGSVQILDPKYGQSSGSADEDAGGGA